MSDCLGVDLGNVIIDHVGFGTTPKFFETGDYNVIPPVPGVIDALSRLNRERFLGNMFVVYNATDIADQKILSWLESHEFFVRTGISPDRVKRTQNGRNKLSICEQYKATHFVDDRLEVLGHLIGKVEHLYLFSPQAQEVKKHEAFLSGVRRAMTWDEIVSFLLISSYSLP